MQIKQHNSITHIPKEQWQKITADAGPFLSYAFLSALERSGSIDTEADSGIQSGWLTHYVSVWEEGHLLGALPGYLKFDSFGEYVFDHAWANAYAQHGLDYYPKWISAVPFTPVSGPRLLTSKALPSEIVHTMVNALEDQLPISSTHILFCQQEEQEWLSQRGYLNRFSVQFQWRNQGYKAFDDFLTCFTSRKRKDIKKERKRVSAVVDVGRATGEDISEELQQHFYHCYRQTYLKRSGHEGYLTASFFTTLFSEMRDNILLVYAKRNDSLIASSLFLFDHTGLYGRYWGALEDVDGLHFESCYYQGIEFAIERGLPLFNPGTQGEHKLLRGFEPLVCHSAHRLKDTRFHDAVSDFLLRERPAIAHYFNQAEQALPFNKQFLDARTAKDRTHPLFKI